MSEAPSELAREFRMAAEFRRCGWYLLNWSTQLNKIELELPNRTLMIIGSVSVSIENQGRQRRPESRKTPAVVAQYLRAYVPPDKLARYALDGPPQTLAECEHRMRELQQQLTATKWMYRILPAAFVVLIYVCIGHRVVLALIRLGPAIGPIGGWWVPMIILVMVATMLAHPLLAWGTLRHAMNLRTKKLRDLTAWKEQQLPDNHGANRA